MGSGLGRRRTRAGSGVSWMWVGTHLPTSSYLYISAYLHLLCPSSYHPRPLPRLCLLVYILCRSLECTAPAFCGQSAPQTSRDLSRWDQKQDRRERLFRVGGKCVLFPVQPGPLQLYHTCTVKTYTYSCDAIPQPAHQQSSQALSFFSCKSKRRRPILEPATPRSAIQ